MKLAKKSFIVAILAGFICISCDTKIPADYVDSIPGSSDFHYVPIFETSPDYTLKDSSILKTIIPNLWSDSREIELPEYVFSMEHIDSVLWLADPVRGEIKTFNTDGSFHNKVAQKGKGPNDVNFPALLKKGPCSSDINEKCIWLMDTGMKALIEYDINNREVNRILNKFIPNTFFNAQLEVMNDGRFIIPVFNDSQSVARILNRDGNLEKSLVSRIVPLGYQPRVYNNISFTYQSDIENLAYFYNGLPQIYVKSLTNGPVKLYDLYPGIPLSDFNIDLTPTKENGNFQIRWIVNNIYYYKNYLLFTMKSTLYVLNLNSDKIEQIIDFQDSEGNEIKYQEMILTGETIYLLQRLKLLFYSFPVSEITGGIQPVAQINE